MNPQPHKSNPVLAAFVGLSIAFWIIGLIEFAKAFWWIVISILFAIFAK